MAVALPVVGLVGYGLYDRTRHEFAEAEALARRLAEINADRAAERVTALRTTLDAIARRPLVRAMDPERCDPDLSDLSDLYPDAGTFLIVDREGLMLCSSRPLPRGAPVHIVDEDLLRAMQTEPRFRMSKPIVGRLSGRWIVAAVQPVLGETGAVLGAVSVATDLLRWPFAEANGLPPDTVITLVTSEGKIVARSEDAEKWIGRRLWDEAILERVADSRKGVVRARGPDGMDFIFGAEPVTGLSWFVLAGLPERTVFAAARERLIWTVLLLSLIVAFMVALSWHIVGRLSAPIMAIAAAARARAEGQLDLRVPVGGPSEVAAVARELNDMIDARMQADRELRDSEARFRALWNTSPDAILMIDEESVVRYASPAVAEVFGYDTNEVIGRPLALLQPERLSGPHRAAMKRYLDTGEKRLNWRSTTTTGRRKDGSEFPIEVVFSELELDARRFFAGYVRDATERVRTHAELEDRVRQRTLELQEFLDSLSTMTAKVATDGRLLTVNEVALAASGLPADELMRTNFLEGHWWCFDAEVHKRVKAAFASACAGEPINYDEKIFIFGRVIDISFSLVPVRSAGGVSYVIAEGRDISSLKSVEAALRQRTAELEEANRELEAFTYSASHDLRAPVRHIDGFVRLLEKELGSPGERASHYLRTIAQSAARMGELIDDLLQLSRTGRQPLDLRRVELAALAAEVIREVAAEAPGRDIEWCVGALPAVEADPSLMRLVLRNLLANAVKYTGPRPRARIELWSECIVPGQIAIQVRDNGVGFDMRYRDKLFGVFQRLHREDEFEGTGIGLATVRRIVNRHGGRAWGEAQPGMGATFGFTVTPASEGDDGGEENPAGGR